MDVYASSVASGQTEAPSLRRRHTPTNARPYPPQRPGGEGRGREIGFLDLWI